MSIRQIVGGNFQSPAGGPLAGGSITFRLSSDATVSDAQVGAVVLTSATLDSNGSISGTVNLWPNSTLTPNNTVYRIKVYTSQGQLAWTSENTIPAGSGTFDLGTLAPLY